MTTDKMAQCHVIPRVLGDAPFSVSCHRDSGDSPSTMPSVIDSWQIPNVLGEVSR